MKRFATELREFVRNEDGAAVAEYGLLLAIVAVGMITLLMTFRTQLSTWWTNLTNQLTATPGS